MSLRQTALLFKLQTEKFLCRVKDPDVTREEFLAMLEGRSTFTPALHPPYAKLLAEVYAHPALPTDLLAYHMGAGCIAAWLNPSASLVLLMQPSEELRLGFSRAALADLMRRHPIDIGLLPGRVPPGEVLEKTAFILREHLDQIRRSRTPFMNAWRPRLLALCTGCAPATSDQAPRTLVTPCVISGVT